MPSTHWLTGLFTALIVLVAHSDTLGAHHGAAAYEPSFTTLTATVTGLDWRNPHALLHFETTDESGAVVSWTAETAGLVILVRAGWHRDVVKPGDRIAVVGRRASNGAHSMILQRLTFPDGRTLSSLIPPK